MDQGLLVGAQWMGTELRTGTMGALISLKSVRLGTEKTQSPRGNYLRPWALPGIETTEEACL
jgi:hypothetical protein